MKWTTLAPVGLLATLVWTGCSDNSETEEETPTQSADPSDIEGGDASNGDETSDDLETDRPDAGDGPATSDSVSNDGASNDTAIDASSNDAAVNDAVDNRELEAEALQSVKRYIALRLEVLEADAYYIFAAAYEPNEFGWDTADWEPLDEMQSRWYFAREAYDNVECAIAVLFPNYASSMGDQYEDALANAPDDDLFDGQGFTGLHAIERILWANFHPDTVMTFESELPGYVETRFPENEVESTEFKESLLARLWDDASKVMAELEPSTLDTPSAFRCVIGAAEEQLEKVNLAAAGQGGARYSEYNLAHVRATLEGGHEFFQAFAPWLAVQEGGNDLVTAINTAFEELETHYDAGDYLPEVPDDWNPDEPNTESEYGELVVLLQRHTDPKQEGSLVSLLHEAEALLGLAELPE